jgi:tetratricopeptide (TPR) repeat protein
MKKVFTYIVALGCGVITLYGCSSDNLMSIAHQDETHTQSFSLVELLQRDGDLSSEEFAQLQMKFNNLKTKYEADNSDFESLLKLAEIYIYEARVSGEHPYYYAAALATLDEVLKHEKVITKDQKFNALFYKATVELSQHHFEEALVTANKALAINKLNSGIYGVLVDANVEIGNYDEAVKMCDRMLEIRPDLRSYSRSSYLREIHGDITGSKVAMVNAINAGAPYSEYKCWSLVTLGGVYESVGQLDSAQICYEFATQERENYPFGVAGIARIMYKNGDVEKAEALYKKAIGMLPEIEFNIQLARMYKAQGRTKELKEMTASIETMFKEDIESGHNMSLEYANFLCTFKKDYQGALKYAKEEWSGRPKNIDVNKQLAFIYYKLGDKKRATQHLNVAMQTKKQDADLKCLQGLIKSDKALVKASFVMNPYQDHFLAAEAKKFIG